MRSHTVLVSVILAVAVLAGAMFPVRGDNFTIGSKLDGFALVDTAGKSVSYADVKGSKGTAVVFLSAQCPVVRAYNERISSIATEYEAKGIKFVGVNSNSTESADWVKKNAAENYKFPVLIDKGNVFADKVGANVTPEIYLFDADNVLVYHGAVDNDKSGQNITKPYLRDAMDAIIAGKKVEVTSIRAFGCGIKRAEK